MIKMISKTKKISVLIIVGFVFTLLVNLRLNFSVEQNSIENINNSALEAPIFINGIATGVDAHNWTWAEDQSWCTGSGTDLDPYIIENLTISGSGSGSGIEIWNSNVSFIIKDCLIYNFSTGIYLDHTNNARLINNNCSNMGEGIYIDYSNNITISGNTANGNSNYGIYLYGSPYNAITGNTVNNNDDGIYMDASSNNNTISGNTANDNDRAGIFLAESDYNNITGNTASGGIDGIFLDNQNYNNTIKGNNFNNNNIGIEIYYSDFNRIIENEGRNSVFYGISLEVSSNNTVRGNNAGNSSSSGIRLSDDCENNTISGNTVNDNDNYGIYLDNCDDNAILGNLANGNGFVGIHLNGQCDENNISGNNVNNNDHSGIYFDGNDKYNIISGNTVRNNTYTGIHFESANNDDNTISGNILSDSMYGINIGNSVNNSIYGNLFLANGIHAMDNGTDNKWNSTTIGNYWDNWTSPDTTPQDGIVDHQYTFIAGTTGGIDHLPIAEDGAPSITINSPSDDDVFGTSAPSFSVTITEVHLDEMWYTLDGGLHNYTFTGLSGTINQTAWATMADGTITIIFYASDIPGNIGTESVVITKSILPAGDDPTIFIVIVIVSIVGGVAVLAVVYIFMKKRVTPE